ncbi:MAG: hypothetical protein ACM3ML_10605 [Micromonosporaceae bacterium]
MSIARSPSSRESTAGAEWRCAHIGNFRKLLPHGDRPFSWINPLPIWRSRNDTLARLLGDPRNYGRLFSLGHIGHWLGFGRLLVRFWFISPDQAAAIMGQRLGITPTRPGDRNVRISWRTRFVASWLAPLPGQLHGPLQPLYSELLDWNDPPNVGLSRNFPLYHEQDHGCLMARAATRKRARPMPSAAKRSWSR